MMGYGVPQSYAAGFPGQVYMMGPADNHSAASLSNRQARPTQQPNMMTSSAGAAAAAKLSSAGGTVPGGLNAGVSKSRQGLEKILDTLSKMFPDVRRSVTQLYWCDVC